MMFNPLFEPETSWIAPRLEDLPDPSSIPTGSVISIDVETYDPELADNGPGWPWNQGYIIGYAVGFSEGKSYYLPVRHSETDCNLDQDKVKSYIRDLLLGRSDLVKIAHNALYDYGWISHTLGVDTLPGVWWDTMWIAALVDEYLPRYSLDYLSKKFAESERGSVGKDEHILGAAAEGRGLNKKKDMWKLPAKYVGEYAAQDATATIELWKGLFKKIKDDQLESITRLEHSLLPLLIQMQRKGVRIDIERAEEVGQILSEKEQRLKSVFKEKANKKAVFPEVWSAESVYQTFVEHGYKEDDFSRTPKSDQPSINTVWLEEQIAKGNHWLPGLILEFRKTNKARGTFLNGMIGNHQRNGRIHTQLHPLRSDSGGTVSGRFSSSSPNLQQVPSRDPFLTPLLRSIFLPEEGERWVGIDFSQQEFRIIVHYAVLLGLSGSGKAETYYRTNDDADYHTMVAKLSGIERRPAKTINFASAYGAGSLKICKQLGLPTVWWTTPEGETIEIAGPEGKAILEKYHEAVPFVRELSSKCQQKAEESSFIQTILGRKCRFPFWVPADRDLAEDAKPTRNKGQAGRQWGWDSIVRMGTHKAMSRLIQGSAADQTKKAMVECAETWLPILQIHDELCWSIPEDQTAKLVPVLQQKMIESLPNLKVPMRSDVKIGQNWAKVKTWNQK